MNISDKCNICVSYARHVYDFENNSDISKNIELYNNFIKHNCDFNEEYKYMIKNNVNADYGVPLYSFDKEDL